MVEMGRDDSIAAILEFLDAPGGRRPGVNIEPLFCALRDAIRLFEVLRGVDDMEGLIAECFGGPYHRAYVSPVIEALHDGHHSIGSVLHGFAKALFATRFEERREALDDFVGAKLNVANGVRRRMRASGLHEVERVSPFAVKSLLHAC